MSINWRPISEFNKIDQKNNYLFYNCYDACVIVGTYHRFEHLDGSVEELIDCGFDFDDCFRHVTHFAEINLP